MGDFGESLIGGGINMGEGVGGLVTNGREAKLAEMEEMVEKIGLLEADVFYSLEVDDIEGVGYESGGSGLDEAKICNVKDV